MYTVMYYMYYDGLCLKLGVVFSTVNVTTVTVYSATSLKKKRYLIQDKVAVLKTYSQLPLLRTPSGPTFTVRNRASRNSGSCFQQFLSFRTSALICNNGVSVIATCPQGGSWLRYALLKNAMVTFHFCFGFNSTFFMHKNYLSRLKWMISTNSHPESMVPWSTKGHQARLCDNLKMFFFLKSGCLH